MYIKFCMLFVPLKFKQRHKSRCNVSIRSVTMSSFWRRHVIAGRISVICGIVLLCRFRIISSIHSGLLFLISNKLCKNCDLNAVIIIIIKQSLWDLAAAFRSVFIGSPLNFILDNFILSKILSKIAIPTSRSS